MVEGRTEQGERATQTGRQRADRHEQHEQPRRDEDERPHYRGARALFL